MLRTTLTACAVVAVAFSTPALAESFDGPYLGIEAGYEDLPNGVDGGVYGVFAGWNLSVSNGWVIGVEGRLAAPNSSFEATNNTAAGTAVSTVKLNNQYGIGAHFGHVIGENTLVYAMAGYERFDVDAAIVTTPAPPCTACNPTINDFSFREDMLTVGAGIEHAVTDRVRGRIAYTYGDGDAYHRNRLSLGVAYKF